MENTIFPGKIHIGRHVYIGCGRALENQTSKQKKKSWQEGLKKKSCLDSIIVLSMRPSSLPSCIMTHYSVSITIYTFDLRKGKGGGCHTLSVEVDCINIYSCT